MIAEQKKQDRLISIHAPLTGCDLDMTMLIDGQTDFNPRTPYGMRQ